MNAGVSAALLVASQPFTAPPHHLQLLVQRLLVTCELLGLLTDCWCDTEDRLAGISQSWVAMNSPTSIDRRGGAQEEGGEGGLLWGWGWGVGSKWEGLQQVDERWEKEGCFGARVQQQEV